MMIEKRDRQRRKGGLTDKTTINISSSESGVAEISVLNPLGQQVARLFDGELDAGEHSFEWNASGAAAGTYFCIVRTGDRVDRAAMVLTR